MRGTMQTVAVVILLVVAIMADGLMDSLGPVGFALVTGPAILIAGLLVCWPDRPRKKKRRPRGSTPRSGKKPSRKG